MRRYKEGRTLKSILSYYYMSQIREYFISWKDEAERRAVKQSVIEEGSVIVEKDKLR